MCLYGSSRGDQSTALPKMSCHHSTTRIRTVPMHAHQYCNACNPPNFVAPDLPSDYLHSRCPCCFGGSAAAALGLQVDCIVSLDANFQLKQIWDYDQCAAFRGQKLPGSQDPKMTLPLTIEVPHCYAEE